ncbi:uncharacterized protein LOC111711713 [Eurytemora carolleeae]|uniref:uncharacterized protein LOC111711713 n=1 Tax=Eurytemora carolleeae TaxID=1294199 RepID=UPI000C78F018|nr:uncharacterized protein LOC111711713 [Eurytemora carolleeae]|eukprot:XP_023341901.1 uncharacterized protein LOC111711713 [Eurytemora affinis]
MSYEYIPNHLGNLSLAKYKRTAARPTGGYLESAIIINFPSCYGTLSNHPSSTFSPISNLSDSSISTFQNHLYSDATPLSEISKISNVSKMPSPCLNSSSSNLSKISNLSQFLNPSKELKTLSSPIYQTAFRNRIKSGSLGSDSSELFSPSAPTILNPTPVLIQPHEFSYTPVSTGCELVRTTEVPRENYSYETPGKSARYNSEPGTVIKRFVSMEGQRRKRLRKLKVDKVTRSFLEMVYNESKYPGSRMKRRLELQCHLDIETIQIWFSSRRQREVRWNNRSEQ